jgi:hypothetical protein
VTQQFCDANHRSEDGDDIDYGGARNDGKDDKTPAFFADYSSDRFDLGFEPELCLPQLGPDRDLRPQCCLGLPQLRAESATSARRSATEVSTPCKCARGEGTRRPE